MPACIKNEEELVKSLLLFLRSFLAIRISLNYKSCQLFALCKSAYMSDNHTNVNSKAN